MGCAFQNRALKTRSILSAFCSSQVIDFKALVFFSEFTFIITTYKLIPVEIY